MENPVLIFGAGDLGVQALDIFKRNNVLVYGLLDDHKELHGKEFGDVSVLGNTDDTGFLSILGSKCEAFVAIGERSVRERLVETLTEEYKTMPINAIHDSALISEMATIGHGNLIGARVTVGAKSKIGQHCLVQTAAVVDTWVQVGDYVTIGAGAIINDRVKIGDGVFIGSGAIIVAGIEIGKNARIGAGSVVVENVPAKATYFGNPARKI
ncbi:MULTISPECIES: acetyltransferase [Dyadobacter]|uniref:Acetyltransferase n=1 Tax=Dyadobacter chenhuakuii TaxID=2909339 RepID=A0A9X1QGT6_9BACT|nr:MULTISPECIES: acetyltransferase [Dyadobacter]MCF2495475.1 acetyltransferase [Dyadobacter chenhuakuii]MCF2500057.1 acetyltransferase [Dyadobacter chenhuakuii]MCF2520296.1 acetyltransferase [Dyadobacter sp. CY351]USJ29512.1 acetyltransferase [Dyadobacter chenhuakuii]